VCISAAQTGRVLFLHFLLPSARVADQKLHRQLSIENSWETLPYSGREGEGGDMGSRTFTLAAEILVWNGADKTHAS